MRIATAATENARTGAMAAGTSTFSTMPSPLMTSAPSATNAAPISPPISACDELDGRPSHHVAMFHAIAPTRPANTTVVVIAPASTIPEPTVAATLSEMKAPAKFSTADSATAKRGDMARVETEVAMAFAVSWKPFVKSNASAVTTTITRMTSLPLGMVAPLRVLDDDALERVRHVLAGVDGLFEALEDVLPPDHDHRVDAVVEQRRDGVAARAVAVVLEAVDLHGEVRQVLEGAQPRHRLLDLARGLQQDVRHPLRLLHRRLDLVEPQVVGDLVDEVDDVVQVGRELEDVLAVDRRDERRVQLVVDVVGDPVALLLADHDVAREVGAVGEVGEHLVEQVRAARDVARRLLEQVEELAVARAEDVTQPGHRRGQCRTRPDGPSAGAGGPEPFQLGRVDRVVVLRRGVAAGAHVGGERGHAGVHLVLDVRVALDEPRAQALADPEQVVEDQDLAVGRRAGADPDDDRLHLGHDLGRHGARHRLEDDREAARVLQRERLARDPRRALAGPSLRAPASERRRGLRREADVAHDRDARAHDRPGARDRHLVAALELDRVRAGLLDVAHRARDRLLVGDLVGAERQVADEQRRLQPATGGLREDEHLVEVDRRRRGVAEDCRRGAVADQHEVDGGRPGGPRTRVVVGGDHHDRLAEALLLEEPGERHRQPRGVLGDLDLTRAGHAGLFLSQWGCGAAPFGLCRIVLSMRRVGPTRAATATRRSPETRSTGRRSSGRTTARYSGSTPRAAIAARPAAATASGSRSPAATDSVAASRARLRASARLRSAPWRWTLRLDSASPSGSRIVGQIATRTGMSRSATRRRMTAACWASFWPK